MKNEELERLIEKSFGAEPEYHLPADFAKKVTEIVSRREQLKNNRKDFFSLSAVTVLLLAVAPCMYYIFDREVLLKSVDIIKENIFPVVFISIILGFILFGDRVLLRFLFHRRHRS